MIKIGPKTSRGIERIIQKTCEPVRFKMVRKMNPAESTEYNKQVLKYRKIFNTIIMKPLTVMDGLIDKLVSKFIK